MPQTKRQKLETTPPITTGEAASSKLSVHNVCQDEMAVCAGLVCVLSKCEDIMLACFPNKLFSSAIYSNDT